MTFWKPGTLLIPISAGLCFLLSCEEEGSKESRIAKPLEETVDSMGDATSAEEPVMRFNIKWKMLKGSAAVQL